MRLEIVRKYSGDNTNRFNLKGDKIENKIYTAFQKA